MKDWRNTLVSATISVAEAIESIDRNSMQIAIVVAEDGKLLGTVTDGDIRRGILKGIALSAPVTQVMNADPTTAGIAEPRENILTMMRQKDIQHVPVLDENGHLIFVETFGGLTNVFRRENLVVLMVGGRGARLDPLTNDCPKPLLKVGGKPVLETILQSFLEYGFYRFCFAVHYKAEMIEAYFGDGSKWGAEITYVREKEKKGTAGALSLLQDSPTAPVLVMNGDVLTKVNYHHLLRFHEEHGPAATMCVREFTTQIPYGVVRLEQHQLLAIEEKPIYSHFVNAGVYVFEPAALSMISDQTYLDMPDLFALLLKNDQKIVAFPIREYWLDIGRMSDFERANGEFSEVFG